MSRPGFVAVVFTTIFMFCALLAGFLVLSSQEANAFTGGGNGTSGDPYLVTNISLLQEMNNELNAYYALSNTITITSWSDPSGFLPVGTDTDPFIGSFDGRGYTIRGLYINRPNNDDVGLFGCIGPTAEIVNVSLFDAKITGMINVGALVGCNNGGTVTDSSSTGPTGYVKGTNSVGALVGRNYNDGLVTGSYAASKVEGNDAIGGLVGENYQGEVTDSYATGNVQGVNTVGGLVGWNYYSIVTDSRASGTVSGSSDVGGLVGWNDDNSTVTDSFATGTVDGDSDAGGLVGENWGTITGSYAEGDVEGIYDCIGGIVGRNYNFGLVEYSYAKGNVEGSNAVGGLVGENNGGTVTESYAAGSATGIEDCVGGLVGRNYNYGEVTYSYATATVNGSGLVGGLVGENNGGSVIYSYAAGAVNGSDLVGGLVGRNYNGGAVSYSFYDRQTTNQSDSGKGVPKTTAELKTLETFSDSYWNIEENLTNLNNGYPYLSWQLSGGSGTTIWYIYNPLCPPPDLPTTPYPLGGATDVPVSVTLDWAACADANLYNVYFSTTASPTYRGSTTASSYILSNLPYSTTFYWRVVAVNDCGSTWGPIWSFTTVCALPSVPQAPSPANNSTNSATNISLSWNASTNAVLYNVYFGTSAAPAYHGNTSNNSYQLPALNYSTKYYWQVIALSSSTCGSNSSVWNFTTAVAPTPTPTPTPTPSTTPTPTSTATAPPADDDGTPAWFWILVVLDVILTVAMVAAVYIVAKRRNQKKRGAAVKAEGSKKLFRLPRLRRGAPTPPESEEEE